MPDDEVVGKPILTPVPAAFKLRMFTGTLVTDEIDSRDPDIPHPGRRGRVREVAMSVSPGALNKLRLWNTETGEFQEQRLGHREEAEAFYRDLAVPEASMRTGRWADSLIDRTVSPRGARKFLKPSAFYSR